MPSSIWSKSGASPTPVYDRELLRLALRLADQGRLASYDGSAERRSRACGSVVVADVRLDGDRIVAFGQDVKACAVGQASAAIMGSHILGLTGRQVTAARDNFSAYLTGSRNNPGSWPEIHMIAAVRDYPARHAAALLPYEAVLAAIDQAGSVSRNAVTSDS